MGGEGGVSTLRRAVLGEKTIETYSWNLKILLGVGRFGKFSRRQEELKFNFQEV